MTKKPKFLDVADLEEDKRIELIGDKAAEGAEVAFITDDEPGKAERYIDKLIKRHPSLVVVWRGAGPVAETVAVKVKIPQ